MTEYIRVGNLKIDPMLHELVREELVPETGLSILKTATKKQWIWETGDL